MSITEEIIRSAETLPVEERARIVDCLLHSLNPGQDDIQQQWAKVARRRLDEIRSGNVKPVNGEQVLKQMRKRSAS